MRFEKLVVCFLICGLFVLTNMLDVSNVVAQDQLEAGQADKRPAQVKSRLQVDSLADLPEQLGVAGPIVGYHDVATDDSNASRNFLIVAGGANFGKPNDPKLWELPKLYHDRVWVMQRVQDDGRTNVAADRFEWRSDIGADFRLSEKVAYSSVVSTRFGVLVIGGNNADKPSRRAFLLRVTKNSDSWTVSENDGVVPDLPVASTNGGAAIVDGYVYVVSGQVAIPTETGEVSNVASRVVWRLKLDSIDPNASDPNAVWEEVASWPNSGDDRMFPLVTSQHDGFRNRLYVFGGRRFIKETEEGFNSTEGQELRNLKFLNDGWSFDPGKYDAKKFDSATGTYDGPSPWKQIADSPKPLTAGTAVPFGPAHVIVPGYATGEQLNDWLDSKFSQPEYKHPGFPNDVLAYHTVTDTWTTIGQLPGGGQVTTPAVKWGDDIFLVSGEVSPRIRTNRVLRIGIVEQKSQFGIVNMAVLVLYLAAMLAVGAWFTFRNKNTNDFFRGGSNIPWWAAGCSIFATMLSSITYMGVPSKAFAQDWVYWGGNFLIVAVAPIAIYVAMPFFRRLDATSAYEYLEKRFNRSVRLVGSGSFSLFHIFRMGVVLALAALALASVTPMTPSQCVIVMGVLSIVYCTLGGIEAVIWTDTVQTVILILGALLCLAFAWMGSTAGSFDAAVAANKFHVINPQFGSASFTQMALWVVLLGGFGQNVASYTADQAVVQRYMTTKDEQLAARSIWLNALLALPATAIFFGLGTAFWMFYRSHPDKLDPTIAADRIMPLFISQELPVGLAGLVVAGVFAAAQSTVSTSMNSGATTIVTDFLQPLNVCKSERGYLWLARLITLCMGCLGMAAGLLFVDPSIKSLWDQFIGILGLFLGVLAGLFALGATTKRANGPGSLIGAAVSIMFMTMLVFAKQNKTILGVSPRDVFDSIFGFEIYAMNGYLYAAVGILVCFLVGLFASFLFPKSTKPLNGLVLGHR